MSVYYSVQIYDSAGTLQAIVTDFQNLDIALAMNAPDMCSFTIPGNSNAAQYVENGAIVAVYRQDLELGIANSRVFIGIMRDITTERGLITYVTVNAIGMMSLLSNRIVAYKANAANLSKFDNVRAETILRTLFTYNIGASATTANGRVLNGVTTGMTTGATGGTGALLSTKCPMQPLLKTMQGIAYDGGVAFTLDYTAPASWVFNVYGSGYIGTDRTASVVFSVSTGTVSKIVQKKRFSNAFNAVVVGGSGTESARQYATRPASLPTGLALREVYMDGKSQQNAPIAYLNNYGSRVLAIGNKQRTNYEIDILQTAALRYGRDYFLGDKITVRYGGASITQIIYSVTLSWNDQGEETVNVNLNA